MGFVFIFRILAWSNLFCLTELLQAIIELLPFELNSPREKKMILKKFDLQDPKAKS